MGKWLNFRQLREHLDFSEVLKHYGVELRFKQNNTQHLGVCPLPNHTSKKRSPTFSANLVKKIWQCFGCEAKGNIIEFATLMEGLDPENGDHFRTVAQKLESTFTSRRTDPLPKAKTVKPEERKLPDGGNAVVVNQPLDFELKTLEVEHPYFQAHGLLLETVDYFGLGFCSRGLMKDRVAIPLHNQKGELIGYAGRLVDDKLTTESNPEWLLPESREKKGVQHEFQKHRLLYHGHRITQPVKDLLVVKSFDAVWWLWQLGWKNIVGLMDDSCSTQQADIIMDIVEPKGHVWILSDGDESGKLMLADTVTKIVDSRFCRVALLPNGKQATDFDWRKLTEILQGFPIER